MSRSTKVCLQGKQKHRGCDPHSGALREGGGLSSALFTLYTSDCRCYKESVLQVKFSDDTSLAGMVIGDESTYRTVVKDLVSWCDDNFLCLNVSKTREMVIDFRKNASAVNPLVIKGEQVEFVHQYKYLGTTQNDKLDWAENSATLLKKAYQRPFFFLFFFLFFFFFKKLKSFKVNAELLELCYHTTTEAIVTYNSLCFYSSLKKTDTAKLSKVTRTASKLTGSVVVDLQSHFERKTLQRLRAILADPTQPLNEELTAQTPELRLVDSSV